MNIKSKTFHCDNGLEIIIGMDEVSNDVLSIKLAHPRDFWFHVNGAPGSHVLLRCGDSDLEPGKDCIKKAAGLAAWYSKMRQGGKTSVHYCRAGDVTKPKGAKPGSVQIRRAKTIFVKPLEPQE